MKKIYTNPKIEIAVLGADVICASYLQGHAEGDGGSDKFSELFPDALNINI